MIATPSYAAFDSKSPLRPFTVQRREPRTRDVAIEILYCGVCHSDLHQVRNEWANSTYPMVPGHEIVGRVTAVGADVKKHAVGDIVGVGCLVDSCRKCSPCAAGLEQYCEGHSALTYNGTEHDGTPTYGGYSTRVVVDEGFVLKVGKQDNLHAVAPILCAGITTYSPLKHWGVGKGHKVAVVGLGGLGHMGVKLAAALGAEVTVVSSSDKKKADAARLGAHDYLIASNAAAVSAQKGRFDFVLDTVSAKHDMASMVELLHRDGTLVIVGAPDEPTTLPGFPLIMKRRRIAGSLIGGLPETQEVLDFCAEHRITSDVEVIPIQEIDRAYDRMLRGDVRYRFVIDLDSLRR